MLTYFCPESNEKNISVSQICEYVNSRRDAFETYDYLITIFLILCFLGLIVNYVSALKYSQSDSTVKTLKNIYSSLMPLLLIFFCGCALYSVFAYLGDFYMHFIGAYITNAPDKWGQAGDFFGGMLNPLLGFCSFMALLYTIQIQAKELKLTREEMAGSRAAQEKTSQALDGQLSLQAQQSFEISFFNIFKLLTKTEIKTSPAKTQASVRLFRVSDYIFVRKPDVSVETFRSALEYDRKAREKYFNNFCEKYISKNDIEIFFILLDLIFSRMHVLSAHGKKWTREENEHYGEILKYKLLLISKLSEDMFIYLVMSVHFGSITGRKLRQLKIFKIFDSFDIENYIQGNPEYLYFFIKETRFFSKTHRAQNFLKDGKHLTKDNFASDPLDKKNQ